jgi:hypothetical protein
MTISDLPAKERPLSEQFRIVAKEWADLDNAANILEQTKSATLSKMMAALGDIPVTHAERKVKASQEWADHVEKICEARHKADVKKLHLEYIRMRFSEWQSANANMRHEARMSR